MGWIDTGPHPPACKLEVVASGVREGTMELAIKIIEGWENGILCRGDVAALIQQHQSMAYSTEELRTLANEFIGVSHSDLVYQLFLGTFLAWVEKQGAMCGDIDNVLELRRRK